MRCKNIKEFINFRSQCFCGMPLQAYCSSTDINNFSVNINLLTHELNVVNDQINISFVLEDFTKYNKIYFDIIFRANSNIFEITFPKSKQSFNYLKCCLQKNFSIRQQHLFSFNIYLKCKNNSCDYILRSVPVYFNIKDQAVFPFKIKSETFTLNKNNERFIFKSNFLSNTTSINYTVDSDTFLIGVQDSFILPLENFLKYDFTADYLLNKVKTFILFS